MTIVYRNTHPYFLTRCRDSDWLPMRLRKHLLLPGARTFLHRFPNADSSSPSKHRHTSWDGEMAHLVISTMQVQGPEFRCSVPSICNFSAGGSGQRRWIPDVTDQPFKELQWLLAPNIRCCTRWGRTHFYSQSGGRGRLIFEFHASQSYTIRACLKRGRARQHIPLIPSLGRQRQEGLCEVEASLV